MLLRPYLNAQTVAIGNSMGGFLAVIAISCLPISVCISFVPQYSVHQEIVPNEVRWAEYRDKIKVWRYPSLAGYFNSTTRYHIFSGGADFEKQHWSKFPSMPNIHNIVFKPWGHNVAQKLKSKQLLYPVIKKCIAKQNVAHFLATELNC